MIRGLYTSALGMTTQMNKMDVVSNNIANVDTTGFKKDQVVTRSFSEELMKRINSSGNTRSSVALGKVHQGTFVDDIYTNFATGSFRNTGGSFDVAISGSGFFAVEVVDKDGNATEKYSRDGAFTVSADGSLMTKLGNKVLGENGSIVIPQGTVIISEKGDIFSNDVFIDRLKMVNFEDEHTLRKVGDNFYDATNESKQIPFEGGVEQGFLENSNANSVKEMVELITTSRIYEANQRMISIHDSVLARTVNDIGRK